MDTYQTIKAPSEGIYTEKRSKFLAFAFPVSSVEEVKERVGEYQKKYYDARHVCYAYMLGAERTEFRANDNGDVAYRLAAAEAINAAEIIEKTIDDSIRISFPYPDTNRVMRIVKEETPSILSQGYENELCTMTLSIRRDCMPRLRSRLETILTLRIIDDK